MNTDYFVLDKGILEIHQDKLHIEDNAKSEYRITIITGICGLIYGIASALRGYKDDDFFWLWSGLSISIAWFILLPYQVFRNSIETEIPFKKISKVELKRSWFGTSRIGRIITSDKKVRLFQIEDDEITTKNLVDKLQEKKLLVIA
jgi:hypothetical protein